MHSGIEECIVEIVENARNAERFSSAGITKLYVGHVKDSPSVYLIPGLSDENNAVLKISNSHFPDAVESEVQKSRLARNVLSNGLAAVIPDPISDGRCRGRSYAIWHRYRPIGERRIVRAVQKRLLYKNLFEWLRGAAGISINRNPSSESIDQRCRLPLERVCEGPKHSRQVRSIAARALRLLEGGEWHPVSVLQHTDFWLGNILLPRTSLHRASNKFGFFLIDWGASTVEGFPGFDLVRLCLSCNVSPRRANAEFVNYMRVTKVEQQSLLCEVIAALAVIGTELNQLPEERYVAMCNNCIQYMDGAGLTFDDHT